MTYFALTPMSMPVTVSKTVMFLQVLDLLKPSNRFFGIMQAEGSVGWGLGPEVESRTFMHVERGPSLNLGLALLFTLEELREFFEPFAEFEIEFATRSLNQGRHEVKSWVVQALKAR